MISEDKRLWPSLEKPSRLSDTELFKTSSLSCGNLANIHFCINILQSRVPYQCRGFKIDYLRVFRLDSDYTFLSHNIPHGHNSQMPLKTYESGGGGEEHSLIYKHDLL
jgi:hypothetical protein